MGILVLISKTIRDALVTISMEGAIRILWDICWDKGNTIPASLIQGKISATVHMEA